MTAAGTFELEIHPYPEHLPLPAAAGMLLFQFQHIPHMNIHWHGGRPLSVLFDLVPVGLGGLLVFVWPVLVIDPVPDGVGQVLLLYPVVWEVVGIQVALLPLKACAVRVNVL